MQYLRRYSVPLYLIIVLAVSWITWALGIGNTLTLSPSAIAILFAFLLHGRQEGFALLRRAFRWRVGLLWWFLAFFAIALVYVAAIGIHVAMGGQPPPFTVILNEPALGLAFLAIVFLPIYGPVGEEIGWRGFLQHRIQSASGPLTASLVIGLFWGIWHLPEFFVEDSLLYQFGLGMLLPYLSGTISLSIIMTWLYNMTGQSTLLAGIVLHAAVDYWGPLLLSDISMRAAAEGEIIPGVDPRLYVITLILLAVCALSVLLLTRGRLGVSPAQPLAGPAKA